MEPQGGEVEDQEKEKGVREEYPMTTDTPPSSSFTI